MKKNTLTLGVCAVLLLGSTLAVAESDYPAADFQPKVIFQDNDAKPSSSVAESPTAPASSSAGAADPNYPAADYQPKVVFQDENASSSKASATTAKTAVPEPVVSEEAVEDSEHPAANFQPKVLYSDPDYKPGTIAAGKNKSGSASEIKAQELKEAAFTSETDSKQSEKQASMDLSLIGIVALALIAVGFVRFKKVSKILTASSSKRNNGISGVSKYLATHDKNAVSGVAKYLAGQAEAKATGVEKYLRKRS